MLLINRKCKYNNYSKNKAVLINFSYAELPVKASLLKREGRQCWKVVKDTLALSPWDRFGPDGMEREPTFSLREPRLCNDRSVSS